MAGNEMIDPVDHSILGDDSGAVVSFAVGPSGVGPVMGFDSGDFFPAGPATDLEDSQSRSADEEPS